MAESLHSSQVCEVDMSWHKVDVPKHEVGVEVDHTFHAYVRQVWQVDHKASHHVEHNSQFIHAIRWQQIDEHVGEPTHGGVSECKVFEKHQNARHETKYDGEDLDGAKSSELDTFGSMQNLLLKQAFLDSNLELLWASEPISHG